MHLKALCNHAQIRQVLDDQQRVGDRHAMQTLSRRARHIKRRLDGCMGEFHAAAMHGEEELRFASVIVVDRSLRRTDLVADAIKGRRREALAHEGASGRVENLYPSIGQRFTTFDLAKLGHRTFRARAVDIQTYYSVGCNILLSILKRRPPMTDDYAGIRVLDVSQGFAGPYCGAILARGGASVVKVEPPSGDWART